MKKTAFVLIAGATAFAAASAFAGHHEGKKEDHMEKMTAKLEAKFAKVDADGNGQITRDEFMAYKMAEAEEAWNAHGEYIGDDEQVSLEEAKAYHMAKMADHKAMMEEHHGKKEDKEEGEE